MFTTPHLNAGGIIKITNPLNLQGGRDFHRGRPFSSLSFFVNGLQLRNLGPP
jgi:hypothetical protein